MVIITDKVIITNISECMGFPDSLFLVCSHKYDNASLIDSYSLLNGSVDGMGVLVNWGYICYASM